MRGTTACVALALGFLARCGVMCQSATGNASNGTLVNLTVNRVPANVNASVIANVMNQDGWGVNVRLSVESNEVGASAASAGNRTTPNCTLTPNATDCQSGGNAGLAWWAIFLIVLFTLAGAAGLGWLIWYLYSTYTPRTAGYLPVPWPQPPPDPKVIPVALVALVNPAPRDT